MNEIRHIILGNTRPQQIFTEREDEYRCKEYLRIYKERTQTEILSYSFFDDILHLVLRGPQRERFILGVIEAYTYYYQLRHDVEIRIEFKSFAVNSKSEYWEMMRYVLNHGRNSKVDFADYSRYVKHPLLDMGPVLNPLSPVNEVAKSLFFQEIIKENAPEYLHSMEEKEQFDLDKMSKRRRRAVEFLQDFLSERGLTKQQLFEESRSDLRRELIETFRRNTDLSFRDIGFCLDTSHTSVIRMMKRSK